MQRLPEGPVNPLVLDGEAIDAAAPGSFAMDANGPKPLCAAPVMPWILIWPVIRPSKQP
jgi:hypothetical protein